MKITVILLIVVLLLTGASCRGTAGSGSDKTSDGPLNTAVSPDSEISQAPENTAGDRNVIMLKGKIGELPVHMSLVITDGSVAGSYYYDNVGKELKLEGTVEAERMIAMSEYDEYGQLTGSFDGWYTRGIRISGTWTNAKTDGKLDFSLNILGGVPANAVWAGEWHRMTGRFDSATLAIYNETKSGFSFQLDAFSGVNMGFVDGQAEIEGKTARFKAQETDAELIFTLNDGLVEVMSGGDISYYAGMGVDFDGTYTKKSLPKETLLTQGYVFNQEQDDAFRDMTGEDYDLFLNTAHLGSEVEDQDGLGAEVYRWWVRGIAGYNVSIVMFLPDGGLCAAVFIPDNSVVRIYTDADGISSVPMTILTWIADIQETLGRTGDLPVEFRNTNKS